MVDINVSDIPSELAFISLFLIIFLLLLYLMVSNFYLKKNHEKLCKKKDLF